MQRILVVFGFLISVSAQAQPSCGHLSQWAHARACLARYAEEKIPQGSNGEHLVYVSGSEKGIQAIVELVNDHRRLPPARKAAILEQASRSEWAGLVIQMNDEPRFFYFLLEGGEAPVDVLDFNPVDTGSLLFPTLFDGRNSGPFTLYLRNLEKWIYEIFEQEKK